MYCHEMGKGCIVTERQYGCGIKSRGLQSGTAMNIESFGKTKNIRSKFFKAELLLLLETKKRQSRSILCSSYSLIPSFPTSNSAALTRKSTVQELKERKRQTLLVLLHTGTQDTILTTPMEGRRY